MHQHDSLRSRSPQLVSLASLALAATLFAAGCSHETHTEGDGHDHGAEEHKEGDGHDHAAESEHKEGDGHDHSTEEKK